MITRMSRVRIMGPREVLAEVLRTVQDLGVLHLASPPNDEPLTPASLSPRLKRHRRYLHRALEDLETVLAGLGAVSPEPRGARTVPTTAEFARWAHLARRLRREVERLVQRGTELEEERVLLLKYQHFFSAFRALLETAGRWPDATAYHVLLKRESEATIPRLRASLREAIGDAFELYTQRLPTGETALLVLVAAGAAKRIEQLLAEAQVQEIPVPTAYGPSLTHAIPGMLARLGEIPRELEAVRERRRRLAAERGPTVTRARQAVLDRLAELDALPLSGVSPHAFVVEGWLPRAMRDAFERALARQFDNRVVVTEVAREEWTATEEAPVVLHNPRLFRPFEAVIRMLPLPRYGSIDPTPFVGVFFPAFFGLMLGDVGYGLVLGLGAGLLHWHSREGTIVRAVAEIAGACAVFTVIAGFLFGEFFGDLGRRAFGLHALAFDREEALVPFLLLAVSLGGVHILIGLGLGVVAAFREHPRHALGRGMSALMIVLIVAALLAVVDVLPRGFLTPAVVGVLIAFPVLIIAEGLVGPLELLSTLGNILSYARIMALGVASVMLAVVANRMVGAMGSVAVGLMFALLFHLVNFAIGLFSPTIHALRLHYVEFFGKFYSPGGVRYAPFRHWAHEGPAVPQQEKP